MGVEIERKFLVADDDWRREVASRIHIRQGYLSTDPECPIRVRIHGADACITIKGKAVGMVRAEFEYPIPVADAKQMLDRLCRSVIIDKVRHTIRRDDLEWVVDEFSGDNHGLVIAEVELRDPSQEIERPTWLGAEVTEDHRYDNSELAVKPYAEW